MKLAFLLTLAVGLPLLGGASDEALTTETPTEAAPTNVNARYIIESVTVLGSETKALSKSLRTELGRVVGANLDSMRLEKLASRIKDELRVTRVKVHVSKGTVPDHVLVDFEVAKKPVDLKVDKFLYDTKGGWSGEASATAHAAGNAFTLGLVSDDDVLLERDTGIRAKFERDNLGTDWLGMRFEFDDFHEMWNQTTVAEDPTGIYRSLQTFTPEARVFLTEPLELDIGVRFARFRLSTPGATTESSNAVVSTLRYHRRWGSGADVQEQELEGSYSVDAATRLLQTDDDYTRQTAEARYKFRRERSRIEVSFMAGRTGGETPLFDRFVLGNASMLRGWSKFDLDPLGGSHVVYGSVSYTYRYYQVFYDTGAVWDLAPEREQKQSVGAGFKKEGFQLAVALPVGAPRAIPVLFAGMNF
jgi:Omp85 superfamily domain